MNIRPMTDVEKRSAAKTFVETWLGRGDEKQDAQNFGRELLQSVFGVEKPESDVLFEYPIKKDVKSSTIFIDAYIKDTAVLIEQKGKDINLRKHYEQSDGSKLTPYWRRVGANPRTGAAIGGKVPEKATPARYSTLP